MNKPGKLFTLVLLLIFILHLIGLLVLFSMKQTNTKKAPASKKEKLITIQKIPPKPKPKPKKKSAKKKKDLPMMMPGRKVDHPEPVEKEKKEISHLKDKTKKQSTSKKPKPHKPTFNFKPINDYAFAIGNSAFKNFGTKRPVKADDIAYLTYQERVRKHFGEAFNKYANQTYFYNLDKAKIDLSFTIDKSGKVINIETKNFSTNPAIIKLMEKILQYAAPFPPIPNKLKITKFELKFPITISEGKFIGHYMWN